jgi:hypothetical protein
VLHGAGICRRSDHVLPVRTEQRGQGEQPILVRGRLGASLEQVSVLDEVGGDLAWYAEWSPSHRPRCPSDAVMLVHTAGPAVTGLATAFAWRPERNGGAATRSAPPGADCPTGNRSSQDQGPGPSPHERAAGRRTAPRRVSECQALLVPYGFALAGRGQAHPSAMAVCRCWIQAWAAVSRVGSVTHVASPLSHPGAVRSTQR